MESMGHTLAPGIWYQRGAPPQTHNHDPSLIVLCTWFGAKQKTIAKYVLKYAHLYPSASLLVLQSSLADMTYRSDAAKQARLTPARLVIQQHVESAGLASKMVLHILSNGGTATATQIALSLTPSQRQQAFSCVIFDCCPSEVDFARHTHAIVLPLEKYFPLRTLATPIVYALLSIIPFAEWLTNYENKISEAYRRTNESEYFPLGLARLYMFSATDDFIPVDAVEAHIATAKAKGYLQVRTLRFGTGPHCALPLEHAEQYWVAIQDLVRSQITPPRSRL